MRALILAAGRGSRMGVLTSSLPKCRTVLAGKSLLQWQLDALRAAGLTRVALVRGYQAATFSEELEYFDNPRWNETNMVGSLLCADAWLSEGVCVISYSDIIYGPSVVRKLMAARADLAITYDTNWLALWSVRFADPLSDAESFKVNGKHLVDIGRKNCGLSDIEGQYMGLLRFTPAGWSSLKALLGQRNGPRVDKMDMTSMLQLAISAGLEIEAVPIEEPWYEVDSETDLRLYERMGIRIGP